MRSGRLAWLRRRREREKKGGKGESASGEIEKERQKQVMEKMCLLSTSLQPSLIFFFPCSPVAEDKNQNKARLHSRRAHFIPLSGPLLATRGILLFFPLQQRRCAALGISESQAAASERIQFLSELGQIKPSRLLFFFFDSGKTKRKNMLTARVLAVDSSSSAGSR